VTPKTEFDYRRLAAIRGFTWLGPELPASTLVPTRWRCAAGHEWMARYSSVYSGSGCKACAGLVNKTADDYHKLAAERGIQWVGKKLPQSVAEQTLWLFPDGVTLRYSYSNIRQHKRRKAAGVPRQSESRAVKEEELDDTTDRFE
jgi:hypothetical protein